jgi:hypothetical protein
MTRFVPKPVDSQGDEFVAKVHTRNRPDVNLRKAGFERVCDQAGNQIFRNVRAIPFRTHQSWLVDEAVPLNPNVLGKTGD